MAHIVREKKKLVARVRRIRGQLDAVERALNAEQECVTILQQLVACQGAIKSLTTELIEGHVRFHVHNPDIDPTSEESRATQELIGILKTYLR
jgi:FrmR/RcnR family transcriptional regulator, repressor of frmRAB operon